jgi:hypothetical protein
MLPYLSIMLASIGTTFVPEWRGVRPLKLLFLLALIVFIGLRFEVGCDWSGYEGYHLSYWGRDLRDLEILREPLSHLFFWTSVNHGAGSTQTYLINAVIAVASCFAVARRTPYPWLGFMTIVPYFLLVFGMSGVRQSIALGIAFYAVSRWDRASLVESTLTLVIGVLFHFSAVFMMAALILKVRASLPIKVIAGVIGGALAIIIALQVDFLSNSIDTYSTAYLGDEATEATGSLLHLMLILAPALLGLVFYSRIKHAVFAPNLLLFGAVAAVGLLGLNFVSSVGASRLSLYLHYIPILVFPAILANLDRLTGLVFKAGVCAAYFFMLWVWLAYANTAVCYLPYSNRLFL